MSYYDWSFQNILETFLQANEIDKAISVCETKLITIPVTPFHNIIGKDLLKSRNSLATWMMDYYLEAIQKLKKIEAIYFEMNGFSINPNLWYVNGFAFRNIMDYKTGNWKKGKVYDRYDNRFIITGLEDLQDVFAFACEDESFRDKYAEAKFYCQYAIVLRLQQLFEEAYKELRNYEVGRIPIFVTAHDYSIIYKVEKRKIIS
jgi:hypothetical protein